MILDVQRRLEAAFAEVLRADADVAAIASDRIWVFGDATHKSAFPCVLLNTVSHIPAGKAETGWYDFRIQLLGSTFRADDRNKSVMRSLVGALWAVAQRTTLRSDLNYTASATAEASALTVADVRIDGGVQDEDGDTGQIYSGLTLAVVCAPHTRPRPVPPSEFDPHISPGDGEEDSSSGGESSSG